tara:strand:- start:7135 stop:7821 length:687 start_codon:yes stop_codon:yes gene_type:complete
MAAKKGKTKAQLKKEERVAKQKAKDKAEREAKAAEKAAAKAEKEADKAAIIKSLKGDAKEINSRLERAAVADGKSDDLRLSAATYMAGAKAKCKGAGISFKTWVEENVTQGFETARQLVRVGEADDPALAIEDMRAKTAARNRKARAAAKETKAVSRDTTTPASAPGLTGLDQVKAGFEALDPKSKVEFLRFAAVITGAEIVLMGENLSESKTTPEPAKRSRRQRAAA